MPIKPVRPRSLLLAVIAVLGANGKRPQAQTSAVQPVAAGSTSITAQRTTLTARQATGPITAEPPALTDEQARLRDAALEKSHLPIPAPPEPAPAVPPPVDLPTERPLAALASADFIEPLGHDLTEISSSARSTVQEPSVGNMGNTVFYSANWYAAVSGNGGQSFSYVNPSNTFPSVNGGFCCDQIVQYAPAQDMMLWLLQYSADSTTGTQRLARAVGATNVANNTWSYYDFTPQTFGFASGNWLDYPNLTVGSTYLYGTSNVFTVTRSWTGSVLWRISLAQLAAGGSVGIEAVTFTSGAPRCTEGALGTMYCGDTISTSSLRIYSWADGSASVLINDIAITPFTWLGGDGVATNSDGTNWAARGDSRMMGAWFGKGVIGLMWMAKQDTSHPYPHTLVARIKASTMELIGENDFWHSSYAWLYPTASANAAGDVAGLIYAGGGSLYPQANYWIVDDISPSFSSVALFYAAASTAGPVSNRWGDYVTVRKHKTYFNTWVGAYYYMGAGGNDGNTVGRYSTFGRVRDYTSTNRPSVTTSAATDISRWGGTLNGTVNPNGASTSAYFEYGTTTSYGYVSSVRSLGSGTSAQAVSAVMSFNCGTLYHYRLAATNSAGDSTGGDETFTTSACIAPTVTTGSATSVGQTSATLNGTVNPNGLSSTTGFDYGTTTSYGTSVATTTLTGTTSQAIATARSTLTCGTLYHVRAKATNSVGTAYGSDVTFTTLACQPPTITTQPASQTIGFGQSATPSVAASGSPTLSYQWYRGASGTTSNPIGSAIGTSYTTPALLATTRYWVRVTNPYGTVNSSTAKIAIAFTDATLTSTSSVIRAVHITELRSRVDALRVAYGLAGFGWTDPTVTSRATLVSVVHITELRTALIAAYDAAKTTRPTFTDPTLTRGMPVKAVHIADLRAAVIALE